MMRREVRYGSRIHAIVLTRDRLETLRRCLGTALSALGDNDVLTILDDSTPGIARANAALLHEMPGASTLERVHVSMPRVRDVIGQSVPPSNLLWLARTAPRDIAPNRNLSLLLSTAIPAETTVLIDDDVHGFDLVATHCSTSVFAEGTAGVIVGSDIVGIDEMDSVTRLSNAIDTLDEALGSGVVVTAESLFSIQPPASHNVRAVSHFVSGGYLAFRLPFDRIFAFPPGYNEDWLWCLLHHAGGQVSIAHSGEVVLHNPPLVRKPVREDLLFELMGDIVFDCLTALETRGFLEPEAVLTTLAREVPRRTSMPSTRVRTLVETGRCIIRGSYGLDLLEEHGLGILAEMLHNGELEMDGRGVVADWCGDAIAKQRSFNAALRNESVMDGIRTLMREGRP